MGLDDYNIESKIILSRFYNRVKKKARGITMLIMWKENRWILQITFSSTIFAQI